MEAKDIIQAIKRNNMRFPFITELVLTDKEALWGQEPSLRRIDGLLIGNRGLRTAVEVKVSRADYNRETHEKRRVWLKHSHRFVYAVPEGLILPEEVPAGIGLWWVTDSGQVISKKKCSINKNPEPVPEQLFIAMCYRYSNLLDKHNQ